MHSHAADLTLGFSFFLGAVHALEPGHGKTAMLVSLLGGKRSPWHPLVMGVATAVSHSVSLFAIAFAVHLATHLVTGDHHHEARVADILRWISGGLVIAVGLHLLNRAVRDQPVGCCAHHAPGELSALNAPCSHTEHSEFQRESCGDVKTTALLGVAVGLLPCPSALAAYFAGLSHGRPAEAYLVIAMFAAGIACSLTGVGFALQRTQSLLSGRFGGATNRRRWAFVRAWLILGIGIVQTGRVFVQAFS